MNNINLVWKRIRKGERLPTMSYIMKKDGTLLMMATPAGVIAGQDSFYLPYEELKEFLKNLPKENSYGKKIRKARLSEMFKF